LFYLIGINYLFLGTAEALTKLLIEKGLINEAEFMQKLSVERAGYQAMLRKTR